MSTSSFETPFLSKESRDDSFDEDEIPQSMPVKRTWIQRNASTMVVHFVLLAIYLMIVILTITSKHDSPPLMYTLANDALEYEVVLLGDSPADIKSSLYVGKSTPELDAAWYRLLRHHNVRITEEEMHAMNQSSIPLGIGGYHGMLAAFHELHCLKLVREVMNQKHYWKDKPEGEKAMLAMHAEHCIDAIRMGIMCRADTAVYTFHWSDQSRVPNPTWSQKHQCINWDKLVDWLDTRKVDIFAPGMLTHPKYGPSYPGGVQINEPNGPQVFPSET